MSQTSHWTPGAAFLAVQRGFLYLVPIMDCAARKVLALAVIEHAGGLLYCLAARNEAIHRFGVAGIMNMVQGSQLTSFA